MGYLPVSWIIASCILMPVIAFILSVFYSYEYRKVAARLQGRRGPYLIVPKEARALLGLSRVWQPLYDILKLLYKETLVPATAKKTLFKAAPYLALASLVATSLFVPIAGFSPFGEFDFSLIVILYLLLLIPLSFIVGGSASSSPWGVYGAQREVELTLAFEVPQTLGMFALAITANTLSVTHLIEFQNQTLPFIILNPFAALAVFAALVGKLQVKPFDISEAEVEIIAGPVTEYTGKLLGIVEIVKTLLAFLIPALFINLFLGGGIVRTTYLNPPLSITLFLVETLIIVFLIALLHVYSPRFRVDQAFTWFLKYPVLLGVIAVLWAYVTRYLGLV